MRGPHVTVRGNAKKYYCSPYGSRALSGRERRWKGGGNFLEKGGAPTFSPPFLINGMKSSGKKRDNSGSIGKSFRRGCNSIAESATKKEGNQPSFFVGG
jgi:hypothetical protein